MSLVPYPFASIDLLRQLDVDGVQEEDDPLSARETSSESVLDREYLTAFFDGFCCLPYELFGLSLNKLALYLDTLLACSLPGGLL